MKNYIKINRLFLLFIISLGLFFTACDEEKMDYGEAFIYMPQATTTGGVNTLYSVPSGGGEMTYNFKAENGKINIVLGITRSGTFVGEDFTVNIVTLKDETDKLIESGQVRNAVPMPEEIYTLPAQVTVTNSNEATFFLSVDSATLINDLAYTGQNMVLTVGLSNPTKYELAEKNTFTNIILNIDAIRDHFFRYKEGFVYRKGNRLYLNGHEYKTASFNAPSLAGCGGGSELFSDTEIDALFASLPDNIMVRTWAFPGSKEHTDKLIKLAEKNNIKLILTLGNALSFCGHIDGASNGEWSPKTVDWYVNGYKSEFLAHVKDMATTYKDSPAIGMWEIIHRPVDADWRIFKTFLNDVAKELKTADPNHLVATGTWAQWAYGGQENLQAIHDSHYIDIGTLHEGDGDVAESWHYPALRNAMNAISKVSMVGEIEIEGGDSGCMHTKQGRSDMIKRKYDLYFERDASVVLVSSLVKNSSGCSTFSLDDPIMDMIRNYSTNITNSKY